MCCFSRNKRPSCIFHVSNICQTQNVIEKMQAIFELLNWLSNSIFLHKRFIESHSRSPKACVHRGLGQRRNKQKNHSFRESGLDDFFAYVTQMYCLRVLLDTDKMKYLVNC